MMMVYQMHKLPEKSHKEHWTLTHFITFAMNDPPCERLEMSGADCSALCLVLPQIFCCWEMKCQIITELERPWSTGEQDWPWPQAIVWSGKHQVEERGQKHWNKNIKNKILQESLIIIEFQDWSEHYWRRRQDSLCHSWSSILPGWVSRPEAQGYVLMF